MTTVHSKIFDDRLESGIYDAIAEQLVAMGKSALADAEYKQDFFCHVEVWSGNYIYRGPAGDEFRTNIIGEICAASFGTIISAKGNHYAGKPGSVHYYIFSWLHHF
jgi:hypothetical protein